MDALMATGCSSDTEHVGGLWWQRGPWTSIKTLAVVGPTDPDMVLGSSPGLNVTIVPDGSSGHLD